MAKIDELLNYLKQNDCSDLHLAAGLEPRVRLRGALEVIDIWSVIADQQLRQILQEITTVEQWNTFVAEGDLDYAYALPGVGRFRANYFIQRNGPGAVFRIIPEEILTVAEASPIRRESGRPRPRLGVDYRPNGLGQVDHIGGHYRSHQSHLRQAHRDHRGSG